MDETKVGRVTPCAPGEVRVPIGAQGTAHPTRICRQFQSDFETFRQGAEQGRSFPGQHAGQPMSWKRLKAKG